MKCFYEFSCSRNGIGEYLLDSDLSHHVFLLVKPWRLVWLKYRAVIVDCGNVQGAEAVLAKKAFDVVVVLLINKNRSKCGINKMALHLDDDILDKLSVLNLRTV